MNINQRIAELGNGGIPRMRQRIEALIEASNWLMGMRMANGAISDGGRGPVIDVGPAATGGAQPWLTDPNGNPAGWVQHDVCINGQVVSKWFWGT